MEKKLQVNHLGAWYFVSSITVYGTHTTSNPGEALSEEYLSIIQAKFPNMNFRSI